MIWLLVIAIGLWCLFQHNQLQDLKKELAELRLSLARLAKAPVAEPVVSAEVTKAPADLVPPPMAAREAVLPAPIEPARVAAVAAPTPEAVVMPPVEKPALRRRSVSDWLSENGLAWIGGGALALGGLMLVAYAAEHGVFTPVLRIWSAVALGSVAVGVGEWLRRVRSAPGEGPLLVAALTTAAGAAILYAAIWAAHALYNFIPAPTAAVLLAAVSLGLLGLAVLHGEAIALLAIAAAYAVPVVTGTSQWSTPALDAFLVLILATGQAAAGLRRWGRTGLLALAGAGAAGVSLWISDNPTGVMVLAIAAPALALGAALLARRAADSDDRPDSLLAHLPLTAVAGASVLAVLLWMRDLGATGGSAPEATFAILATLAIVAVGLRLGLLGAYALGAVAGALVIAALRNLAPAPPAELYGLLADLAALAVVGGYASWREPGSERHAVIAAAGVALALTLSAPALATTLPGWAPAIDLAFAALFGIGAIALSRRVDGAGRNLALAAWVAASAETVGLALHAGLDARVAPTAYGLLALVLAGLAVRVRWRGLAESAAIACLASFAALLGPAETGAAISGSAPWTTVALVALGAAAAQGASWWVLRRREDLQRLAEAASTLAIMSALLGAFLVLERWSGAPAGHSSAFDGFTNATLRTLLLLATGLTLALRGSSTPIGLWRTRAFVALGALHGLFLQALLLHPWWGERSAQVIGPPVFDLILLGFLAPALLLLAATRPLSKADRGMAGPATGAAILFLLIWLATEVRRLFHGPVLTLGPFGYAETASYAAALLGLAVGLEAARGRLPALVAVFLAGLRWAALGFGLLVFGWIASPWWGPLEGDLRTPLLLGLLYAVGCIASYAIALAARRDQARILAPVALAAAGALAFALITLAVRYGFHGAAMRAPLREASIETWTFSAVWAVYGFVTLALGAGRKDIALRGLGLGVLLVTTAKVFLFDMARLEGVVRAASFLALGVVLLAAALAARRLGAGETRPRSSSS